MALNKNILPGTRIRVKSLKAITSGIGGGPVAPSLRTLDCITIRNVDDPWIEVAGAYIGDTLTVINAPRRVRRVNYCRVETDSGLQGEVFWTELRSNCEEIAND